MEFDRLKDIRCFLLDMDGTVCLGEKLLKGARDFIDLLSERDTPFYFLTNNSSRSRIDYAQKLNRLGLPVPETQIFTSGEATAIYLKKHKEGARLFTVATPSLEEEFQSHGFELVEEDPDYVVIGFDTTLTYKKLWKLCDFVREGRPYIATHPDINCPTETGFMPDIGSMIALVASSTGREPDVIIGKPNTPIIEAVVEKTGFSVDQLAMVGDRLYTDIALGVSGITTILVLSGETKPGDLEESPFKPDFVMNDIQEFYTIYSSL